MVHSSQLRAPTAHLCLALNMFLGAETLSLTTSKLFDIQIFESKNQRESTILISYLPNCLQAYLLSSDFLYHALSLPQNYIGYASSYTHRG